MGISLDTTNKLFTVVGIIFQLWFILMYAIDYRYIFYPTGTATQEAAYNLFGILGFVMVVVLLLLYFLGFTLINIYVGGSAYSNALFSFLILVFTIQYYFIIRSFWIGVGLANDNYDNTLADGEFTMLRILSTDYRINSSYNTNVGMTEAIVCAMSILIGYMGVAGRVGAFQVFALCFFGVFFYSFNQTVIWRHQIADNGYTMRIFLYGATLGVISGVILKFKDKQATTDTLGYMATRRTRSFGLIGTAFIFLLMPILYTLGQIYNIGLDLTQINYLFPAIINAWFALSASACMTFCMSILLTGRIHPHDVVFSSFAGGVAYGATSTLNPDPFPAILIGLISGAIVTLLNHKLKKPLNNPSVIDTHAVIYSFFVSGLIGGIYSAIMSPIGPFGADVVGLDANNKTVWVQALGLRWLPDDRDRFQQGGMQIAGTFISIAIGALAGIVCGLVNFLTTSFTAQEVIADPTFTEMVAEGGQE